MFDMKKIGRGLVSLRNEHNMTQMELADRLGISFQAISNWERGNTMPDISKLPELAEIFNVTIDEILRENVVAIEAGINDTIVESIQDNLVSEKEIVENLPLLKPEQIRKVARTVSSDNIVDFLPFMSEDDIKELAILALEKENDVDGFLPFMMEDDIKELANLALEKENDVDGFLPFMMEDHIKELANLALEKGNDVDGFLPFMSEDDVKKFAIKLIK